MVNLNWAQFEMLTVFYIYVSFAFKNPLSEDQIPSKKKKKKDSKSGKFHFPSLWLQYISLW